MKKFHLVKTYFHRRSRGFDEQWLTYRLSIYKKYTLRSLAKQTFRDFRLWIHCDRGMETMMAPLGKDLPGATLTFGQHFPSLNVPDCDWVYVTRLDSDDLYRKDALGLVDSYTPAETRVEATIFQKGYIHDLKSKAWGIYANGSSPFHCVMFPRETFVNQDEYRRNFVGDHSKVRRSYPILALPDFKFCVLIHERNWSSSFEALCTERLGAGRLDEFL